MFIEPGRELTAHITLFHNSKEHMPFISRPRKTSRAANTQELLTDLSFGASRARGNETKRRFLKDYLGKLF